MNYPSPGTISEMAVIGVYGCCGEAHCQIQADHSDQTSDTDDFDVTDS